MDYKKLQTNLGYQFKNLDILQTALTHRSSLNQLKNRQSNERLEYLGDAVLELTISDFLYHFKPKAPEGILTTSRSAIVRTESLAQIAQNLNLGQYIIMSKGEEKTGGRQNISLLANTTEAITGAIFLDGGFVGAKKFVHLHILPHAKQVLANKPLKDNKSLLQEIVQRQGFDSPTYKEVDSSGPDHDKIFTVAVLINGKNIAQAQGKNKQEAQQKAAKKAINLVK